MIVCCRAINSTRSCLDVNLEFCEVPFTFNVASAVTIDSLETAICSGESPLRPRTDRAHLLDSCAHSRSDAFCSVLARDWLTCSFAIVDSGPAECVDNADFTQVTTCLTGMAALIQTDDSGILSIADCE